MYSLFIWSCHECCSQLHSPRELHFPGRWRAVNWGSHDLLYRTTLDCICMKSNRFLKWTNQGWVRDISVSSRSRLGHVSTCLGLEGWRLGLLSVFSRSWEFTFRSSNPSLVRRTVRQIMQISSVAQRANYNQAEFKNIACLQWVITYY